MSVVSDFMTAMQSANPDINIDYIGDILEYGTVSQDEAIELSNLMIRSVLQEENNAVRESIFHALSHAVVFRNVGSFVEWNLLVDNVSKINSSELEYVLTCLGFSHNKKYIPFIESFLSNASPMIREVAQEALEELSAGV